MITMNFITKNRSSLKLGDIIKYNEILYKCTKEKTKSIGIGYGDTFNFHLCEEVDNKMNVLLNGRKIESIIGFSAELGDNFYDVLEK
jgi:hypothetical protein